MDDRWQKRRWVAVGVPLVLIAVLALSVYLLSDHLRGPILRYAEARWQRPIRVDGAFEVHLLSLHPRLVAEQVTIGNPPWSPEGVTAQLGRLELICDVPWISGTWGIRRLEMDRATLHLLRDERGRANWQVVEPGTEPGSGPPLIRSLSMPDARVYLDDARRRLQFDGTVSAREIPGPGPHPALRLEGSGQLNGRAVRLRLSGDPLASVRAGHPYGFEFSEESGGSRLAGRGSVPRPFDVLTLQAGFEATGPDMKDLYFLTGVSLPATGQYRLTGKFSRQGDHLAFADLAAITGHTDVGGQVLIDARDDGPAHLEADLHSQLFRVSDIGARASGREQTSAASAGRLLPDTPVQLSGLRRTDALIRIHVHTVEVGSAAVQSLAGNVVIQRGTLVAAPITAQMREGKVTGSLRIDATQDIPVTDLDLKGVGLELGSPGGRGSMMEGQLQVRVTLEGHGNSIHEVASNANGTVTAVLPRGSLRSSVAELAGLDLRGLGLMATGSQGDTGVRCGVASFDLKKGTLTAQRLLVDTDPVLISGQGTVDLGSETLDLRLRGKPKHPRLRVRASLLVHGTLRHPQLSIGAGKPAAQAGGALALGVLLTPVAAMLAFVDPGLAKDTDCAALITQARTGEP